MSTVADLPASAKLLTGPSNAWQGSQDDSNREESFTWKVPWGDSNAFYQAVVGQMTTISYGNGLTISRRIPLQHPYNPALWATRLSWRGADSPRKAAGVPFAWVLVTISFGYPGFSMGGGDGPGTGPGGYPPFVKISSRATPRLVTDTGRQYTYSAGGTTKTLNQNVAVAFGGNSYQLTLFQIPDINAWQAIVTPLCGTVNNQPFALGAFTRAAGTVLFEGYGFEEEMDVAGNVRWTGTVDLNCSSLPWNSTFVAGAVRAISPAPYQLANHNTLYY